MSFLVIYNCFNENFTHLNLRKRYFMNRDILPLISITATFLESWMPDQTFQRLRTLLSSTGKRFPLYAFRFNIGSPRTEEIRYLFLQVVSPEGRTAFHQIDVLYTCRLVPWESWEIHLHTLIVASTWLL